METRLYLEVRIVRYIYGTQLLVIRYLATVSILAQSQPLPGLQIACVLHLVVTIRQYKCGMRIPGIESLHMVIIPAPYSLFRGHLMRSILHLEVMIGRYKYGMLLLELIYSRIRTIPGV